MVDRREPHSMPMGACLTWKRGRSGWIRKGRASRCLGPVVRFTAFVLRARRSCLAQCGGNAGKVTAHRGLGRIRVVPGDSIDDGRVLGEGLGGTARYKDRAVLEAHNLRLES